MGSRDGFPSVKVALAINGDELRSVPRQDVRVRPWEANELLHPSRLGFADTNSHFKSWILHVVRLRVRYIDPPPIVKGNSARAPKLGPGGGVVALLIEDLNPAVAAISYKHATIWINSDGVQGAELSWGVACLYPRHEQLAAAVVLHDSVVSVRVVPIRYEHVTIGGDCHITW